MDESRSRWNRHWREKPLAEVAMPDDWLIKASPLLRGGRALDIACGAGRNSFFLAENGFQVTAVDISPVALERLALESRQRQLDILTRQIDLEGDPQLPEGPFDLLINFFYLHRPLLGLELARVKPGGLAVFRTFSRSGLPPQSTLRPEISLNPGELLEIFSGWEILLYENGIEPSRKGGTLAGIVARRPDRTFCTVEKK